MQLKLYDSYGSNKMFLTHKYIHKSAHIISLKPNEFPQDKHN